MMTIDVLEELVARLALRHHDPTTGRLVEPMLEQVREAISPNIGRTHSGHSGSAERAPFDLEAFMLYEDIEGRIASLWLMATETGKLRGSPEKNLQAWFTAFDAAWVRNEISEAQLLLALSRIGGFISRIENYFDPASMSEILAPCPEAGCGERYWLDRAGNRQSALIVVYRPGRELVGRCRCCAQEWHGDAQLVQLAKAIDVALDVDAIRDARSGQ